MRTVEKEGEHTKRTRSDIRLMLSKVGASVLTIWFLTTCGMHAPEQAVFNYTSCILLSQIVKTYNTETQALPDSGALNVYAHVLTSVQLALTSSDLQYILGQSSTKWGCTKYPVTK